ncbi:MAG: putative 4-mercaptohistidine N1-methyltransferase [Chthoniobacteraceae bacterium]
MNLYETDRLLSEYLLFHYGTREEILPYPFGPAEALDYAVRCVTECVDSARLRPDSRALDLGCAVGRSSFELARNCREVVAIDYSRRFIEAASQLRDHGELAYERVDEGSLTTPLTARVPTGIDRSRVQFETGDAQDLRDHLGAFDVVLMANLIDRLAYPARCLERLPGLVNRGGQLILTSPYTWMSDYTEPVEWLGGKEVAERQVTTFEGLEQRLSKDFTLRERKNLPFLIREHARKFQWSVAEATIWVRK